MEIDSAQVTIKLSDLNSLRSKIDELELELSDARKHVDQARLGGDDSHTRRLATAVNHAITIVSFAVATMDPLTVRGWPYEDLHGLGDILPDLAGVSDARKEIASGFRLFAKRAKEWELARDEGTEQEKLAEENAARGASALAE